MAVHLVFILLCLLSVPSTLAAFEASTTERELLIFHRAKKVLELMKSKSCKELTAGKNCTILRRRSSEQMNFYMAEKLSETSKLNVRVPLRPSPYDLYNDLDAVVIVDPMPDAHFGHPIVVTLIKVGVTQEFCKNVKGSYYRSPVSEPECMYLPVNNDKCLRMAQLKPWKKLRKACSFDFIPFVYDTSKVAKQQLRCFSKIPNFGQCPKTDEIEKHKCNNKLCPKTNSGEVTGGTSVCGWSCDYALLVSGGWSKYTNRVRHLYNIQDMFKHLNKNRRFDKKNIKVFFANNATIELDGDQKAKETVPAVDASTITQHVRNVCSKDVKCIDTFVIYLNGPTTKNGDLLLWDWNEDGTASNAEILTIKELLSPLQFCNAKNFLIIADQNYAGYLIDNVREGRRLGLKNFEKIHVLTASDKESHAWRRDFTKLFIRFDKHGLNGESTNNKKMARRISSIAKDLQKSPLLKRYNVHYLEGSNKDLTLTGQYGLEGGCS